MRIRDWSSDVCSSDLKFGSGRGRRDGAGPVDGRSAAPAVGSSDLCSVWWVGCSYVGSPSSDEQRRCEHGEAEHDVSSSVYWPPRAAGVGHLLLHAMGNGPEPGHPAPRSEEHTSELQSLMRISYAVFCLNKKKEHRHKNS